MLEKRPSQPPLKINQYVEKSLLFAIGSSYATIWRKLNVQLKSEQCNLLQAVILISVFFEKSSQVTPSMLARSFHTSPGNVSHCISHLEKKGFLKRSLSEYDARSYELHIKPEGKKVAVRLIKMIDECEQFFECHTGKQKLAQMVDQLYEIETAYRQTKKI